LIFPVMGKGATAPRQDLVSVLFLNLSRFLYD